MRKRYDTIESKWGGYTTKEEIQDLKNNKSDWAYQKFAELGDHNGFDMNSYLEHYHLDDEDQENSDNAKAMNIVIGNLKNSDIFDNFNKTANFCICRVEHNY